MFVHERPRRFLALLAAALAICFCSHGNDAAGEEQDRQGKTTTFAAAIDAMVQECQEQAADLKAMPLDFVGQAVQLQDEQGSHLEQLRSAVRAAAEALDTNCPKDVGAQLSEKIAALDHALQVMQDSLKSLHPALASFYSLLGDEQKAQLVAMTLSNEQLSALQRRLTRKQPAPDDQSTAEQNSKCLQWEGRLKSWPVRQVESATALSNFQRANLYELTAVIYRSAGDLTQACPAGNPLTPVARLELREHQFRSLQHDIQPIQPYAAAFENALSGDQRKGVYTAIGVISTGVPQTPGPAADAGSGATWRWAQPGAIPARKDRGGRSRAKQSSELR
jgi:LTXXQ motif family protein